MIDRDEIIRLAKLSKFSLDEVDIKTLTKDIKSIINFADKIDSALEGEQHFEDEPGTIYRNDNVEPSYSPGLILKNAPTFENDFFKLPRREE